MSRVAEPWAGPKTTLTDEGEVVIAARGIGDGGAAVRRHANVGQVGDGSAVCRHWTAPGIADADGDGYYDGDEVNLGTDPLDAASFPVG